MKKEIIKTIERKQCINVAGNEVESLRNNNDIKNTVRIYDGGAIGVAGKIGNCDEKELEKKAAENLRQGIPYPETEEKPCKISVDRVKEIIPAEEFVPTVKRLIARLTKENPQFIFSNKVIMEETEKAYASSCGAEYRYRGNEFSLGLALKYKGSANIMDEFCEGSADYYNEDEIASDAKLICDGFLKPLPQIEEDEIPVIFDGAGPLQYFFGAFVADMYCNGASLLNGKLGEKVFNENFTVALDRNPDRVPNIPFFDAEGVVNEDYCAYLVKNGVMRNLLTNKRSAAMYNVDNIGSSSADYDAVPDLGAAGVCVAKTHESVMDIIGNGRAVFATVTSGGDSTPSGDFSIPCMVSYLYENGELKGRLPEFAISGNIFDAFCKDFLGRAEKGIYSFGRHHYLVFRAKLVNKAN